MITLRLSGQFLARFLQEGMLYEPIWVKTGLPPDAMFQRVRTDPSDFRLLLLDFEAAGPPRTIEAVLVNAEPKDTVVNARVGHT